jgi:hypothetical protein
MKGRTINYIEIASIILIGAAVALIALSVYMRQDTLISTVYVFLGVGSFISGTFAYTLSKGDPFDPAVANLLVVQEHLNLCAAYRRLGVLDSAIYAPQGGDAPPVVVVMPIAAADGSAEGEGRYTETPSGMPLLEHLQTQNLLVVPTQETEVLAVIKEALVDNLELAEGVEVRHVGHPTLTGDSIAITISGYRLFESCKRIREVRPRCCTSHPCPVCSLILCILVKGLGRRMRINEIALDPKKEALTIQVVDA